MKVKNLRKIVNDNLKPAEDFFKKAGPQQQPQQQQQERPKTPSEAKETAPTAQNKESDPKEVHHLLLFFS